MHATLKSTMQHSRFFFCVIFTLIQLVDLTILLNWMSPFQIKGMSDILCLFLISEQKILHASSEHPNEMLCNVACGLGL